MYNWSYKLLPKETVAQRGCMFKLLGNNYYSPTATERESAVAIG